jgi:hypothetical protein
MKRKFLTLCFTIGLLKGICQDTALKDVLAVEAKISRAVLDNDTARFSSFLTEDYEFSVPEGNNISKKQFLLDMKKFWHPTEINRTEQHGRIYKNAAIVTGMAESKWRESDKEYVARERYTDTYIFEKGKWLLLASHSSEDVVKDNSIYEKEVKDRVLTLWKGWETGNRALAEPIYAKDFLDTDFEGTKRNKEEVLKFLHPIPSGESALIVLSDWHFIVKNSTVVVNYVGEDTRTKSGKSTTIKFRATDTFIKRYGHWLIISGQQVLIKK